MGHGGGKAVLALGRELAPAERTGLLTRYARLLNDLAGAFATGQDLGTTPEDMAEVARATRHELGGHGGGGLLLDPGPFPARGVLAEMRASLARAFGSDDPAGRRVAVQGVGDVGAPLARLLAAAGAELVLADPVSERLDALAAELGADTVPPERIAEVPCDVYAPCAVGATVNAASIPRLACRVVCGSATNQLAEDADADRLHAAGVLYAPDYVANAGGAIAFGRLADDPDASREDLHTRVDAIRGILDEVFAEAAERDESPLHATRRRVRRTLDDGRRRRASVRF
jgi:leucine dehydrogenase